ncbi:hypothetical protein ACQRAW_12925 [Fusicatenibacter saccharivorans]|uniref:hypothetical protein n=1 Tax=Fusicatenibacter saccharivorans TaxID=1150298 RepID=UPI003CFF2FC8
MEAKKSLMPQNFKNDINWIIDAYELAKVTFPDGFQKDAIQNAVGARSRDSWSDWKCRIDLIKNSQGVFLVIEDEGTEGLTGPNISTTEIMDMIDKELDIDHTWRLARFSSRNVSGGNQIGAGKYGVGKSVYSACSKDYDYFFDSLRKDGLYVANRNECGTIYQTAFENDEARKFIVDNTGLPEKTTVGTRVIIVNPKEEICESINSGEIIDYIQESWWRCIEKMPEDSGIYINGKRVDFPEFLPFENKYETKTPEKYAPGYRVKKFGFFINKKGENKWKGVSYYRRGMKIGSVDIADIPSSIKDRFWGYIEVDKEWEERLADIEDAVHYGVKSGGKHTTIYQNMRLYISEKVNRLLVDWGYVKDKEHEDKKLQEALKEISSELQSLFDDMGFEDLGKGAKKPDFSVRWKDIQYPQIGTEKVITGDTIGFGFKISNDYLTDRKFQYSIDIISKATNLKMSTIKADTIKISAGTSYEESLEYTVDSKTADRFEENRIVLVVKVGGSTKEKRKELPFFYDTDKEDNSRREVSLSLHTIDYPRENSRRVNFGEILTNISYKIDNKRNFPLDFSLNISIHNCEDTTNPKIVDIGKFKGSVNPFEETLLDSVPDIEISQEVYEKYLDAGVIELRARLVAMNDSDEYEKGDRITHFYQKIYLNKDEKSGKDGAFEPRTANEPSDYKRSWCKGGSRLIFINSGHPAYIAAQQDDEEWRSYMKQEMLKQYVLLYLEEGKYSMFGNGEDITQMDPIEAGKCIMDKVEEVYQKSFQ